MADYIAPCTLETAQYCLEQARFMLDRARFMWSEADKALQEAKHMRAALRAQIEELAKRGAFRRQFTLDFLARILDSAVEGTGADMGNIQLLDSQTGQLLIRVQRGFNEPFLKFCNSVQSGEAACGTVLKHGCRVIVPDVANSTVFSGTDVEVLLDAHVRAVQSTPLIARSGRVWGMLSTHYRNVNQPGKKDLHLIDYLADWAAEILEADFLAARPRTKAVAHSMGTGAEHPATAFLSAS